MKKLIVWSMLLFLLIAIANAVLIGDITHKQSGNCTSDLIADWAGSAEKIIWSVNNDQVTTISASVESEGLLDSWRGFGGGHHAFYDSDGSLSLPCEDTQSTCYFLRDTSIGDISDATISFEMLTENDLLYSRFYAIQSDDILCFWRFDAKIGKVILDYPPECRGGISDIILKNINQLQIAFVQEPPYESQLHGIADLQITRGIDCSSQDCTFSSDYFAEGDKITFAVIPPNNVDTISKTINISCEKENEITAVIDFSDTEPLYVTSTWFGKYQWWIMGLVAFLFLGIVGYFLYRKYIGGE